MKKWVLATSLAFVVGIVLVVLGHETATTASARDARLEACGAGADGRNTAIAAFDISAASRIWDYLPALGISPELSNDDRPAYVAVFNDGYRVNLAGKPGFSGVHTLSGVVCVIPADGIPILYSDVSRVGFRTP